MATFDELLNSEQFQLASPEDKIRIANSHWDAVARATPEEEREQVELYRNLSVGGLEAIGRSAGVIGPGTFKKQYENEAQAYNDAWGALTSGDTDEETFGNLLNSVQSATRDTLAARQQAIDDLKSSIEKNAALEDGLVKNITQGDDYQKTKAAELASILKSGNEMGGLERNSDGLWTTLLGEVMTPTPEVSPPSAPILTQAGDFARVVASTAAAPLISMATSGASALGKRSDKFANAIQEFQNVNKLTDDQVKAVFSDLENKNRDFQPSEMFRTLSSGQLLPNKASAGLLDKKAATEAILASTAPEIAKEALITGLDGIRDTVSEELAKSLAVLSENHGIQTENFNDYFTSQKKANPELTTSDIVSSYVKKEKFSAGGALWSELTTEGFDKLLQTGAGVAGALGLDAAGDYAAGISRDNQKMAAAAGALFGDRTIWDSVVKETPSIAATILLTKGAGASAYSLRGLGAAAEMSAAEAAALQASRLSVARGVGMVVGVGSSALQSAGVTYADQLLEGLERGMNRDAAHERAQGKAVAAGITTGLITSAFSLAGRAGIEGAGLQRMTVGEMAEEAARRGIPMESAVRSGITSLVGGISKYNKLAGAAAGGIVKAGELTGKLAGSKIAQGYLNEAAEEGIDQLVSKFVTADPGTPVFNAFEEAWEASKVGGIFGTFSGVSEANNARKQKSMNEAQRAAAMQLEKLKASPTARVLTEEEIAAAAPAATPPVRGGREFQATPDQRKPGQVTEEWTNDDGHTVGLRYNGESGVTAVVKDESGEWIPFEGDNERDTLEARTTLLGRGYTPTRGINKSGESVEFSEGQKQVQLQSIRQVAADRIAQIEQDAPTRRAEEQRVLVERAAEAKRINDARYEANLREAEQQEQDELLRQAIGQLSEADKAKNEAATEKMRERQNKEKVEANQRTARQQEEWESLKESARSSLVQSRAAAKTAEQVNAEGRGLGVSDSAAVATKAANEPVNPDNYAEGSPERAAADRLISNGITTVGQAIAAANDPVLHETAFIGDENAEGVFPTDFARDLNTILRSPDTRMPGVLGQEGPLETPARPDVGTPEAGAPDAEAPEGGPPPTPAPEAGPEERKTVQSRIQSKIGTYIDASVTKGGDEKTTTVAIAGSNVGNRMPLRHVIEEFHTNPDGKKPARVVVSNLKDGGLSAVITYGPDDQRRVILSSATDSDGNQTLVATGDDADLIANLNKKTTDSDTAPEVKPNEGELSQDERDEQIVNGRTISEISEAHDAEGMAAAARLKRSEQAILQRGLERNRKALEEKEAEQKEIDAKLKDAKKKREELNKKKRAATKREDFRDAEELNNQIKEVDFDIKELNERSERNNVERARQEVKDYEGFVENSGGVAEIFEREAENLKNGLDAFGDPLPENDTTTTTTEAGIPQTETPAGAEAQAGAPPVGEGSGTPQAGVVAPPNPWDEIIAQAQERAKTGEPMAFTDYDVRSPYGFFSPPPPLQPTEEASTTNSEEESVHEEVKSEVKADIESTAAPVSVAAPSITNNQSGKLASDVDTANTPAEVAEVKREAADNAQDLPPDDLTDTSNVDSRGSYNVPASRWGYGSQSPIVMSAKTMNKLLSSLSKRFNLKIQWTSIKGNSFGAYNPNTGEIYLNKDLIEKSSGTPIHEVSHAFLASIKSGNPELYSNLMIQMNALIDGDPVLQRIRNRIIDTYAGIEESAVMDELMATYMGLHGDGVLGRRIDDSNAETKAWAKKAWEAITNMMSRVFKGRMKVADLGPDTTLEDLASMITDPAAYFDIGGRQGDADVTSRTALQEFAFGMRHATNAAIASMAEGGLSIVWSRGRARMVFGGDGKADIQTFATVAENLNRGIPQSRWTALREKLKGWTDYKLGGDFWKGNEDLLAKVRENTNDSPINTQNLAFLIDEVVLNKEGWYKAEGSPTPNVDFINSANYLLNAFSNMGTGRVRMEVTGIPSSYMDSLIASLGDNASIITDLAGRPDLVHRISPEQTAIIQDALQHRAQMADALVAASSDPNLSDDDALDILGTIISNEHEAFGKVAKLGLDMGLPKDISPEEFGENRIPGELKGWVRNHLRQAAIAGAAVVGNIPSSNSHRVPATVVVVRAANEVLTHAQKTIVAKALGFTAWTSRAEDAFASRFADFIVDAKTAAGVLVDAFRKVGQYLRGVVAAGVVALSVTGSTTNEVDLIPMSKIAADSGVQVNPGNESLKSISNAMKRTNAIAVAARARAEQQRRDQALTGVTKAIDSMTAPAVTEEVVAPAGPAPEAASNALDAEAATRAITPPVPSSEQAAAPIPAVAAEPAPAAAPPLKSADLGTIPTSEDATTMANWVIRNNDAKGKPFILADKNEGTVYFFDDRGILVKKAAALFGKTIGDIKTEAQDDISIEDLRVTKSAQITRAGRFEAETRMGTKKYGELIPITDTTKEGFTAIHKVFLDRPAEKRQDRLNTPSGADNRISLGCINLHDSDSKMANELFRSGGVVYIMPETEEGVGTFSGFQALREGRSRRRSLRYARSASAPKKPTKSATTPARLGDGTRDGLYNNISADPAYKSPTGAGRLVPRSDGKPQVGFKKLGEALSFRAKTASREGLQPSELKVVTTEKGGEISYFVVVPDALGQAESLRVADSFAVTGDPTIAPVMPTLEQNRNYINSSGNNLIKLFRMISAKAKEIAFEQKWLTDNKLDQSGAGEILSTAVQNNFLQNAWGKSNASAISKALRAKHGNPFETDRNFGSPTYGHALGVAVKPGQSPFMGDIMQKAMVDPRAYDLTPEQTAMVDDFRSLLEQMREHMRKAHLDKDYLKEGGFDLQKFLDDPTVGDNTWREYFPREVLGHYDENGVFQRKMYIGSASPQTINKSLDQSRMVDPITGRWLTHQQISEGTLEQKSIVYSADEFEILEGFLSKGYSSIAASDLAQNIEQFAIDRGPEAKASLRNAFVRGVPILNDSLFENEVAKFLDKHLVANRMVGEGTTKILEKTSWLKNLTLGFDFAAAFTVAGVGSMTQPFREGGVTALIQNMGGQLLDVVRSASTDPKVYQKMCAELAPYTMEMAILNGKIGSSLDWTQTQNMLAREAEIRNAGGSQKGAVMATMAKLGQFGKRLSDYHSNVCEIGKVQMWRSVRRRFLDENGNLRQDEQSINDMREEVRSIDRSFGYSNDLDISTISASSRAWMNILGTAPGMYISMINNALTKNGAVHIGEYMAASVIYFVAAAVAAGMDDDEIKRRLNPLSKGFMAVDVDMGSGGKVRVGFSQFYKALLVATVKQADVFKRAVVDGETLTTGEMIAPIWNFARARVSPAASAAIGLATSEDYMGRHVNRGGAVAKSMLPTSLQDPISILVDNTFGTTAMATAQEHFTASEHESMKHKAVTFVANVMGVNAYTLDARQSMNEARDRMAREQYGTSFKDMKDVGAASEIALKVNQQFKDIPKWTDPEHIAEIQANERERFTSMLPSEYKNYIVRSGAIDQVRLPGIKLRDGSFMYLTGLPRDEYYRAAAKEAIEMPGGIASLKALSDENGINPANQQKLILDALNGGAKSENASTKARLGVR